MTEFALVLPVFSCSSPDCSGSAASSSTGSGRTTWRTRRPAGRRSTEPRTPPTSARGHAKFSATREFASDAACASRCPTARRSATAQGQDGDTVHLRPAARHRDDLDPRRGDDAHRASRRSERHRALGVPPDAIERSVRVSARLRSERGRVLALTAMIIPAFLLLSRARPRRGDVVHAQALAPEPRRRGRARRGRRVPLASSRTAARIPQALPRRRSAARRSSTRATRPASTTRPSTSSPK